MLARSLSLILAFFHIHRCFLVLRSSSTKPTGHRSSSCNLVPTCAPLAKSITVNDQGDYSTSACPGFLQEENGEGWSRKEPCCAPVSPVAVITREAGLWCVHQGAPRPCRSPSAQVPALSLSLDPEQRASILNRFNIPLEVWFSF